MGTLMIAIVAVEYTIACVADIIAGRYGWAVVWFGYAVAGVGVILARAKGGN